MWNPSNGSWTRSPREKQLKGWSAPKKQALIMQDEAILHELAKCNNHTRHDRPERDSE